MGLSLLNEGRIGRSPAAALFAKSMQGLVACDAVKPAPLVRGICRDPRSFPPSDAECLLQHVFGQCSIGNHLGEKAPERYLQRVDDQFELLRRRRAGAAVA